MNKEVFFRMRNYEAKNLGFSSAIPAIYTFFHGSHLVPLCEPTVCSIAICIINQYLPKLMDRKLCLQHVGLLRNSQDVAKEEQISIYFLMIQKQNKQKYILVSVTTR